MSKFKFNGSNDLKAGELFTSRVIYRSYAYSGDTTVPQPNPFFETKGKRVNYTKDFWFIENLFYGRLDPLYNAIQAKPAYLRNIASSGQNPILVLDFVGDAFDAFRRTYVRRSVLGNQRGDNPAFIDMNPKRGYQDVTRSYNDYILGSYYSFVNSFLDQEKESNINSFKKFIMYYMDYLKIRNQKVNSPITKTSFIVNNRNSPMITGLCIEIDQQSHGTDSSKVERFIEDIDFKFYSELATKFGFLVDKNAPWRLVANIGSAEMLQFAQGRHSQITKSDDILIRYYKTTYLEDFEEFRSQMLRLYNTYVDANPSIRVPYIENGIIKTKNVSRKPLTRQLFDLRYPWSYWIESYVEIRNMETSYGYSTSEVKRISKNALSLLNSLDEEAAVSYVNRKFKGFAHREGSLHQKSIGKNSTQKELQLSAKKVSTVLF